MELRCVPGAQEEKHPRDPPLIEGEVLRRQHRLIQPGGSLRPQTAADGGIQPLVVPNRRVPPAEADLHGAAGLRRNLPAQGLQEFPAELMGLLPIGPQASLQPGFPTDGVAHRAGGHFPEPQHPELVLGQGVRPSIGPAQVLRSGGEGVPALRRLAQMDALSGDGHRHLAGAGHQGPGAGKDAPRRKTWPNV